MVKYRELLLQLLFLFGFSILLTPLISLILYLFLYALRINGVLE